MFKQELSTPIKTEFSNKVTPQCFIALQFLFSLNNREITMTLLWFCFRSVVLLEVLLKQQCSVMSNSFAQTCEVYLGKQKNTPVYIHKRVTF